MVEDVLKSDHRPVFCSFKMYGVHGTVERNPLTLRIWNVRIEEWDEFHPMSMVVSAPMLFENPLLIERQVGMVSLGDG